MLGGQDNSMEIDNINDILREVITFLECLREAQLPVTLESLRKKLLIRSKNTLIVTRTSMTPSRTSSPEPYLDMKSGPKSLLLTTKNEADSEEYVGMCVEESQKRNRSSHQDYYETFENERQSASVSANDDCRDDDDDDDDCRDDDDAESQMLVGIYKNLSAMQIRSKCYKCGPLYRREGKKLFLSESRRACWIALVGSYLLIYRSERHNRPYAIYPIRGYMARPAPNMIPRDRRKSESAFEMYSPGNETLQFIARTPKDMDQWIAKICEVGCRNEGEKKEGEKKNRRRRRSSSLGLAEPATQQCRRYRDAHAVVDNESTASESVCSSNKQSFERKDDAAASGKAPPLPARIPRRLPSLPPDNPLTEMVVSVSYRDEEDEEDDIYHRIEDLRNVTPYQNMVLSKKKQADVGSDERKQQQQEEKAALIEQSVDEAVAYDDVRTPSGEKVHEESKSRANDVTSVRDMYDDIVTTPSRITDATSIEPERNWNNDASRASAEEKKQEFYDDVQNLIPNRKFIKDQMKMSSKLEKKSFLGRVLSRRESDKYISDKRHRYKGKVSLNSTVLSVDKKQTTPTYDDVSDLTSNQESLADEGKELPEYNCPPPPRPIYEIKSLAAENQRHSDETRDFYDDVSAYQGRHDKNHDQEITLQSTRDLCTKTQRNEVVHIATYKQTESKTNGAGDSIPIPEETEHYQSPRSVGENCYIPRGGDDNDDDVDAAEMEQTEELYDDIALWVDFTARQRDLVGKRENEDTKSISSDKKAWNRFAVNRKSRVTSDFNCSSETNKRCQDLVVGNGVIGNDVGTEEMEDSSENNSPIKRNTFLKLISRMENSFAKVSARSPSSLSTAKSSSAPSS